MDVPKLQGLMKEKASYRWRLRQAQGSLTFNMGDETEETMSDLFAKLIPNGSASGRRDRVFRRYIRPPLARPAPCRFKHEMSDRGNDARRSPVSETNDETAFRSRPSTTTIKRTRRS